MNDNFLPWYFILWGRIGFTFSSAFQIDFHLTKKFEIATDET